MDSLYRRAEARVEDSPRLRPFHEFILADWPQGEEHWVWVLTASEEEILDWADVDMRAHVDED